jgi:hypothetical protein
MKWEPPVLRRICVLSGLYSSSFSTVIAGGGAAPGNGKVCQRRRCEALGVDQRRSGLESRVPASTAATA